MNKIIPHLIAEEHFGQDCAFWNSFDDWFLERDLVRVHRYNGSLHLTDLTHAMKAGKLCEEIIFQWYPHAATPRGLYGLLRRHDYNLRALLNELVALPWEHCKHWKTGEPQTDWASFKTPQIVTLLPDFANDGQSGTDLCRRQRASVRTWSPFAQLHPLTERPKKWTIPHVLRALFNGQFSNLQCHGVYSDDYAYDNAVNYHKGEFGQRPGAAVAFARRILESPSGWWASDRGEAEGTVSICCHSFDSNSFKFELMSRFNPCLNKPKAETLKTETPTPESPAAAPPSPRSASEAEWGEGRGEVKISFNAEKKGLELRFATKPDESVRDQLKGAGFRWSRFSACWYVKDTPESRAWVEEFMGTAVAAPVVPVALPPSPARFEAAQPEHPPLADGRCWNGLAYVHNEPVPGCTCGACAHYFKPTVAAAPIAPISIPPEPTAPLLAATVGNCVAATVAPVALTQSVPAWRLRVRQHTA